MENMALLSQGRFSSKVNLVYPVVSLVMTTPPLMYMQNQVAFQIPYSLNILRT